MKKVLILEKVHSCITEQLENAGWQCDANYQCDIEELANIAHNYHGVILRSRLPMQVNTLKKFTQLEFIGRPGAGLENIDTDYCKKNGIEVFRSPEGNRDALAEHTLGMIIMLTKNLRKSNREVIAGQWKREENRGRELRNSNFGIIGYGYMGKAVAQRLSGFKCNVFSYDKYLPCFSDEYTHQCDLEFIKEHCDFISIHVPQTKETEGMINADFLNGLKKKPIIINTARGNSVDTKALLEALDSHTISGACLDVLEQEGSSFEKVALEDEALSKLVERENVIITPHIAGWTHEAKLKMGEHLVNKILDFYS